MTWTMTNPIEPGWYWFQAAEHLPPIIVCLHMDNSDPESVDGWVVDFAGDERHMESNKLKGRWAGPLPLPEEEKCWRLKKR